MIIAEYKFNNSTDTLPTFNHGVNYTYTYEDVVEGEITTRTIYSDSLPTTINFISSSITELIYLDISNITDFTDMFHDCNNLVTVNASDWDTSRVTNMCSMFNYCHRLTNIDVSNWDTSQVTDMSYMFGDCNFNLTSLDLSNWDTSKVTDMSYMFNNCTKLTSVNMNNSDVYSINDIIEQLPTRTEDNPGTLKSGAIAASSCDIETASSKYWNIVSGFTIAIYTFNSGTDTLPTFNDGYTYSYEDIVEEVSGLEWFDKSLAPNTGGVSTGSGAHTNFVSVTPGERYHIDIDYARVFWYDENQNFISQALHGNNETIIGSNGKEYATNGKYAIAPENARYMRLSRGHGDTEIKIFIGTTTRTITSDTLPTSINFSGESGLVSLSYLDTSNVTDMSNMFSSCGNLTSIDLSNFDTSNVTNMYGMFYECSSLTSLNLNSFNTSKVTDMSYMFCYSSLTSIDLSNFNTSNVTSMSYMFGGCTNLTSIDVSYLDTSNVTDMSHMFDGCSNLTSIDMDNSDIDSINDIIEQLPTRTSSNPGTLKSGAISASATANSKYWNVHATIAEYKFNSSTDTLPTFNSGFTYEYTDVDNGDGTITRTITSDSSPTSISFIHQTGLLSLSYLDTSNVTSMQGMFEGCSSLISADLSSLNTSNVTNMSFMFYNCKKITTIEGLNNFDTSKVTNMQSMFYFCNKLTSVDLTSFDTSEVTNMRYMFYACNYITSLDLSSFNTNKVTDMQYMFYNCNRMTALDLKGWDISSEIDINNILTSCSSLTLVKMNNSNVNSINKIIAGLPTRTADSMGTLKTGTILASDCNIETASSKYWNIVGGFTVATYTFNSDTDTLPTFNDEFIPTSEKTESRTIFVTITESTFNIPITSLNDIISIEIPRYEGNAGYQKKVESNSDYIRVEYTPVTSGPYIRIDSTGKCTVGCSEPWDANEDIVIKYKVNGYNYTDVDNGDGTVTRTITSDTLPTSISFMGKTELVSVSYLDTSNVTNMSYMLAGCINLTYAKVDNWNTSKVTDMSYMFYNCQSLTSLDVSSFNTSNVTNMSLMFHGCNNLTSLDVSSFNTSKVTNMYGMFWNCNALTSLDVSSFNTSKVTDMGLMFIGCNNLTSLDVSSFNTSNVTNMYGVFYNCKSLISLDLTNFDTGKVTDMSYMFYYCKNLTSLDVSSFDTSNVTDMGSMFYYCNNLTSLDVSSFDTGKVTDMSYMFYYCNNLTSLDVSSFDTSNVTDMYGMFYRCSSLTTLDVNSFNTSNVTDIHAMFGYCYALTSVDVSSFNTSNVTAMSFMFVNCINLTSLDVSSFDTSNVTIMNSMFSGCDKLTSLDLSNFNTSNVTTMESMFNNCNSLTSLDVSGFDTSKVDDMGSMFSYCYNLKYLDISNFKINPNCNTTGIFEAYGIENIGMLHCDSYTVNVVANNMHADSTIWVQDTKAYEYEDTNNNGVIIFRDYKEQEIEIDLPQPLRSIGNYKDRLYWDEEKGRYCIEQIIGKGNLSDATSVDSIGGGWSNNEYYAFNVYFPYNVVSNTGQYEITMISEDFISSTEIYASSYLEYEEFLICRPHSTVIKLAVSRGDINTYNDYMLNYIKSLNTTFYWVMNDPIVIETDITEKLNFDTYNDSMYISINDSEVSPSNISTVIAMKELPLILSDWSNVVTTTEKVNIDRLNKTIVFSNNRTQWYDSFIEIDTGHLSSVDGKTIKFVFNKPVAYRFGLYTAGIGAWYNNSVKYDDSGVTEFVYTFVEEHRIIHTDNIYRLQINYPYNEEITCMIQY